MSGPREKDQALANRCRQAATAAIEGAEWLAAHGPGGAGAAALQRELRRHAVEARRLAIAAERPMSVGVFGASQMGKSFLIGKLITPPGRRVRVIFGTGAQAVRQDFLEEVNPAGGDETTGLVTRFSLRPHPTPPGFPVVLRMLREVDIAKILANSFQYDLKGQYRMQTGPDEEADIENATPTPETIAGLAAALAPLCRPAPQPGFPIEAVLELQEYVRRNLRDHLMAGDLGEVYWAFLEDALPRLDGPERMRALAPLWAGLPEFSDLYLTLKAALDRLGHPEEIFAPLDALADRARGVLHVDVLQDLDARGAVSQIGVMPGLSGGALVHLPVAVASALTAELFVTLEEAPWDFLNHTDLLDFPGARSRGRKSVWDVLRKPEEQAKHPRSQCFRRGKVAVLFDNYNADLDLNAMLLCKDQNNQEVAELPDLVLSWVKRTHGETPEQRQGRPVALFFCMTKCDTMLTRVTGNDNPVENRFANNLRKSFPGGWIAEWAPGTPFRNVFMLRNPAWESPGFFTYAPAPAGKVGEETGYVAEFAARMAGELRPLFLDDPLVRAHVEDPGEKFDGMLALNDGGSTLLAARLAPICQPELKYDQIAPRAARVQRAVHRCLKRFHESGDIAQRVAERVGQMTQLIRRLRARPEQIGPFISAFHVEEPLVESAYLAWRRTSVATPVAQDAFAALLGEAEEEPAGDEGFGRAVAGHWATHLAAKVPGNPYLAILGLPEETLRAFVNELVAGADRALAHRRLEERIDHFTQSSGRLDATARRIAIFGTLLYNDLVNYPGGREAPANARRFQRVTPPAPGVLVSLPEDPAEITRQRLSYFADWFMALEDLARDNARQGVGGAVDIAANTRLEHILARLEPVPNDPDADQPA